MSPANVQPLISIVSHAAALLAFAAFAAILVFGGNRRGPALYLIVACALTAIWSSAVVVAAASGRMGTFPELALETLRNAAWVLFLYQLLGQALKSQSSGIPRSLPVFAILFFFASIILVDAAKGELAHPALVNFAMIGRLKISEDVLEFEGRIRLRVRSFFAA